MSCYAYHLIPTEDNKIDRFARGLILGISNDTASGRRNTTFVDFVDLALDLERIQKEKRAGREQNKEAHTFGTFSVLPISDKGHSNMRPSGPPQSMCRMVSVALQWHLVWDTRVSTDQLRVTASLLSRPRVVLAHTLGILSLL